MNRRLFITALLAGSAFAVTQKGLAMGWFGAEKAKTKEFPYTLSDSEWREKLDKKAYYVLREHGTERAGSSSLNNEKRKGVFHCKGCGHPLFSSDAKYESGTGWPSFFQPINDKAVGTSIDNKLFYTRDEIHCANCGGHLGHVFEDGPEPTGLRYCMNGIAMVFKPTE